MIGFMLCWVVLVQVAACNNEQKIIVCTHGLDPQTQQCKGPDLPDSGTPDSGVTFDSVSTPDTFSEDIEDGPYQCVVGLDLMNKAIGEPCSGHGDCDSCYCYDEGYLAPFRFCSQPCESGAGSGCPDGRGEFEQFTCLRFSQQNIKDYGLTVEAICMPVCETVSDCDDSYNACSKYDTKWDGKTISGRSTCQIQ